MKLQAEFNNQKHEVEVRRDGEKLFAEVDGRVYQIETGRPEPNVFLFKEGGRIDQIFVSPRTGSDQPFLVQIGNHQPEIKITDPKKLRGSSASEAGADGVAEIKTAMPGKLVRILVAEGSEVAAGEGVLVVEAMKMQNEMKSPKNGIVREIRFREGETVNAGQVLAIIE
ncbi:MAG: biotin/lipoyl-containing protein [Pyrinomonadaceae bacterium]